MDAAVLVVNWNTPDDLDRCLSSLRIHDEGLELAVHQNYYSDELSDKGFKVAHRYHADIITQSPNVGHGKGINVLAKVVQSEYLFIVNPDCVWKEPVVARLVSFLKADPDAAIVGPKQMDSKNRITAAGIVGTLAQPEHRYWHHHDPQNTMARDIVPATVVAGSALMISKEDFWEYGGMLEAKHYFSETWLCYHAQAHGRTCWYYGEPWMVHEWHQSSPQGYPGTDGMIHEDQKLFRQMCDEHNPPIPHD